jgi:hypothetical protein
MIVCDDVLTHAQQPSKPVIVGLTTSVNSPRYPFILGRLSVYLVMTSGRGQGTAKLRIVEEGTDQETAEFSHTITFPANPLAVVGLPWRLRNVEFPRPGMYRVEFCYNDQCLAQQLIEAR